MKNGPVSKADKISLQETINSIESNSIKIAINDFISPQLGLELRPAPLEVEKVPTWVLRTLDANQCFKKEITPSLLKDSLIEES